MIAVRADSPYKTLKDLMDTFKKILTASYLVREGLLAAKIDENALLAKAIDIDPRKMRYVAFEGGGETLTALLGNHIQVLSGDISEMTPYINEGKIRILAVYSDKRLGDGLSDIPTAKNKGMTLYGQSFVVSIYESLRC